MSRTGHIDRGNKEYSKSAKAYRGSKIPLSGVQAYHSFSAQLSASVVSSYLRMGPATLVFTKDSISLSNGCQDTKDFSETGLICRTFLRAGIKKITFSEEIGKVDLEKILIAAQGGLVEPLLALHKNPFVIKIVEIEEELRKNIPGLIPGKYKHYTSPEGYQSINSSKRIKAVPHSKNGRVDDRIYITPASLSPDEVRKLLFRDSEKYAPRGWYVIAFDLPKESNYIIKGKGIEMYVEEDLPLDQVIVRYNGPNDFHSRAQAA